MGRGKGQKRRFSAGTKFMLGLLVIVLCGSAVVLGRLSSGATVDLGKLQMNILDLQETFAPETEQRPAATIPAEQQNMTQPAAATAKPANGNEQIPENAKASYTLTIGGSISLSGEVRKNSWNADAKMTDYSDVMMLLAPHVKADVNCVFLENILSDEHKANDYVAPAAAASLLKEAGFGMAACGFSQAYTAGENGLDATVNALEGQQIRAIGIGSREDETSATTDTGHVKTTFLQYTTGVPAKTRKNMGREGTESLIPEAEITRITDDIADARARGAEAVIVLLNWGKTGKDPDRAQKELAEGIAMAGADLIVGNGSHVPQKAEYITGRNGKNILCVWSLGSLLCGDRANIKRISGYLLHVTVQSDGQGGAEILHPEYTPVYTWKYKQDGRYYYHCIASNSNNPDGMDSEQRKNMAKSLETVTDVLLGSPVTERRTK